MCVCLSVSLSVLKAPFGKLNKAHWPEELGTPVNARPLNGILGGSQRACLHSRNTCFFLVRIALMQSLILKSEKEFILVGASVKTRGWCGDGLSPTIL